MRFEPPSVKHGVWWTVYMEPRAGNEVFGPLLSHQIAPTVEEMENYCFFCVYTVYSQTSQFTLRTSKMYVNWVLETLLQVFPTFGSIRPTCYKCAINSTFISMNFSQKKHFHAFYAKEQFNQNKHSIWHEELLKHKVSFIYVCHLYEKKGYGNSLLNLKPSF